MAVQGRHLPHSPLATAPFALGKDSALPSVASLPLWAGAVYSEKGQLCGDRGLNPRAWAQKPAPPTILGYYQAPLMSRPLDPSVETGTTLCPEPQGPL